MISPLIETTRGWELSVQGWKVTRCFLDPAAFGFLVDGGTGDILRLYVEGQFTFVRASGAVTFGTSDQDPTDYAPLLSLMGAAVAAVEISSDGELRVAFESGDEIQVAPDPDYEAWELEGLGRLMVACTPGGGQPWIFNG